MRAMLAAIFCTATVLLPIRAVAAAGDLTAQSDLAYIEVTASAEIQAAPDRAILDFGVVTRAETASAATQQNGARMTSVLAAVRRSLGPRARIGTGTYALRTEYAPHRDGVEPRIVAYVASNIVRLETDELSRLGEIIDGAIEAGSNQVQRIAFALSDPAKARRSALREAVLQARNDAETMASALNVKLGAVQSISNQEMGPVRPFMQEAMVARGAPSTTPIEPGQVSVHARVVLRVQIVR